MERPLNKIVLDAILKYNMLIYGDHVLVAVSGGPDSVCLLNVLFELRERFGLTVSAVHINHLIRGEKADADEDFVKILCRSLRAPLCLYRADVPLLAKKRGLTLEDAGRVARYACYEKARRTLGATKIAVAHTKNDNAETVIMRLCRGTGLNGLGGIPPVRGAVIRPLINASRGDVLSYCAENAVKWRTDETNADTAFTRNNIRAVLMPSLRKLNPKVVDALHRTAALCRADADFLDEYASGVLKVCSPREPLSALALKNYPGAVINRVLRKWLARVNKDLRDVSSAHIESVERLLLCGNSGNSVNLPKNVVVKLEYGELKIDVCHETSSFCYDVVEDEKTYIKEADKTALLTRRRKAWKNVMFIKTFNRDKINLPQIRSRMPKDRVYVEKIGGHKKISDYFSDRKLPSEQRGILPILADGSDVICVIDEKGIDSDYFKSGIDEKNAVYVIIWEGDAL